MHRPDEPTIRAALREHEMRAEHRINRIRAAAIATASVLDLTYATLARTLSSRFLVFGALALAFSAVYVAVVHRLTRDETYRPWLKYVTITLDYVLLLAIFLEYRHIGFFARRVDAGIGEMIVTLLLLNLLSAFRYSRSAILYSSAVATAISLYVSLELTDSLDTAVYAPIMLFGSGLLTLSLSSRLADLFLQARRRELLMRFLPREVVNGVDAGEVDLELGGRKQEVTILLSDLRGFTALAEHRDPQQVVAVLNEYFTAMAAIIWECRGTIDKFIGDAILAVFGAPVAQPDHALQAVRAALRMQEALGELNRGWSERGSPVLAMGIALHTGTVVAGNVGSPQRMEYTVIGDPVNLTARIEELNKTYGTRVLLSETTYDLVGDHFAAELVSAAPVRGRSDPVRVYKLVGW